MGIQTQLLGIGNNDEIVTLIGHIDISEDGKMALLTFENKSPLPPSGPESKLISLTLNKDSLKEGEARILDVEPAAWKFAPYETAKSKMQVVLHPEQPNLGLAQNEKLVITLLNMKTNGKFKEEDFLGYGSENQLQVIASFNRQDSSELVTIEGYFFKAPDLKPQHPGEVNNFHPSVTTTSLAPYVTTTPPPNVTTTPPSPESMEPCNNKQANPYEEALSILRLTSKAIIKSILKSHPNDPGFNFKFSLFGIANIEVSSNFSFQIPIINKLCVELIKGVSKV
ncbi:hypothetical protein [Cytobacillus sp. BC1816]|uniref:hypothetical protein n=1 Tax=Cytobacillus sp. BC1816 TaxID=3440154 RepID=UPI003F516707